MTTTTIPTIAEAFDALAETYDRWDVATAVNWLIDAGLNVEDHIDDADMDTLRDQLDELTADMEQALTATERAEIETELGRCREVQSWFAQRRAQRVGPRAETVRGEWVEVDLLTGKVN